MINMSDYIPTNGAASTRWLTEEVFKLIEFVQRDEAIYNPRHKYYFCRPYVENFWREVDQKLDKNPGASLAKWTNLRISFRREFTNYLEEKVPPCWSYFDRMFFLHPYLRKKQQTSKQGENSLQETLAQISELSNRLERQAAEKANKPTSSSSIQHSATSSLQQQLSNVDNYFDYYDEPEQNNSESDEIIEEDRHEAVRYPQVILETAGILQHKIKSEHEDEIHEDDFEMRREILLDSDIVDETLERNDTSPFSNLVGRLGKRNHNSQQQLRLEHLNRLQTRTYHEDLRAKRPRSQERTLGNTIAIASTTSNNFNSQRSCSTSTPAHSSTNVSFVRPTVSKSNDVTSNVNSSMLETLAPQLAIVSSNSVSLPPAQSSRHHGHRYDAANSLSSSNMPSINSSNNTLSTNRQLSSPLSAAALAAASTPHLEMCDCKTDPDAMFLMSLLPDIQKLNGRDRGKIKIAFQNILQDYLYPD